MALKAWPDVLGEVETLQKLLQDQASIARFGDGECSLMRRAGYIREPPNERLAEELRHIVAEPDPRCKIGIPTLDTRSPKHQNWVRRMPGFLPFLSSGVQYVSAFISRPDSSPWIETVDYAESMQALWQGRKAVVLAEATSKLRVVVPQAARKTAYVECPHREAYAMIGELERAILRARPEVVILSCGPTATCLAHRLAVRGIQALDVGSVGGFLARMLVLERLPYIYPMVLRHPECADSAALRARLEAGGFEVFYGGEKA